MVIVNLILLKNRNFARMKIILLIHKSCFCIDSVCGRSIDKLSRTSYFGRIFRVPEVCISYKLLQTVLFFTDSVFRVLFAYFDASMASIGGGGGET